MNTKASGKTVKEVLDSVVQDYSKRIIPEASTITSDAVEFGLKHSKKFQEATSEVATEEIQNFLLRQPKIKEAEALIKNFDINNAEQSLTEILKEVGINSEPIKEKTMSEINKRINHAGEQVINNSNAFKTFDVPAYFLDKDKKTVATRIGTTVAGIGTVNIAGRYLSGGTLTTDRYGRKDIAGIPFV